MIDETDCEVIIAPVGTHDFSDFNHVRNFVRYLFSDTRRHPAIAETRNNYVTEYQSRGDGSSDCIAGYLNDNPKGLLGSFLRRRLGDIGDPALWLDDVFYMAFILPDHEGNLFSNFAEVGPNPQTGRLGCWWSADEGAMQFALDHYGGPAPMMQRIVGTILKGRDRIRLMDAATPAQRQQVEALLHEMLHQFAGGDVAIAVSHNDQPGDNESYHIHRIRRRVGGEVGTVTHDEIAERNRQNPYPADLEQMNREIAGMMGGR